MTVAERGNRRSVSEADQPGFVDHPDRLDDTLKYRRREALPGQRRRLADTIGRSSSLSDPQAGKLLNPGFDSTTARLSQPHMREHLPQFCANALARTPGQLRVRADYVARGTDVARAEPICVGVLLLWEAGLTVHSWRFVHQEGARSRRASAG